MVVTTPALMSAAVDPAAGQGDLQAWRRERALLTQKHAQLASAAWQQQGQGLSTPQPAAEPARAAAPLHSLDHLLQPPASAEPELQQQHCNVPHELASSTAEPQVQPAASAAARLQLVHWLWLALRACCLPVTQSKPAGSSLP